MKALGLLVSDPGELKDNDRAIKCIRHCKEYIYQNTDSGLWPTNVDVFAGNA